MMAPGGHVQVETACVKVVAVAVIDGVAQEIGKPPGNAGQVVERQPDVALALVVFIIDSDHNAVMRIFPGPGQEGIPGLIAAPGGGASQLSPRAVTEDRSLQQADEL